MRRWLVIIVVLLLAAGSSWAFVLRNYGTAVGTGSGAVTYINCPSGFTTGGACGVGGLAGTGVVFNAIGGGSPALSGSQVMLMLAGSNHAAGGLNYMLGQVNVQNFTTVFTFIPNGQNFAFVINNTNNQPGYQGSAFLGGAGCEAGFFQGFDTANPNNAFAVEFDSYLPLLDGAGQTFSYSSVQAYTSSSSNVPPGMQCPCMSGVASCPGQPQPSPPIPKFSTSPVPLNSPATTPFVPTGDVYNAKLVYSGTTLTLNLFDVTASGACPGASCFTKTWTGLNIPSVVAGTTAWVGFVTATGSTQFPTTNLYVNSWTYTSP